MKNWDNLQVGDVIVDKDGYKAKVLEVLTNVFLMSVWSDFDVAGDWYTCAAAQRYGYIIKGSEDEEVKQAIATLTKHGKIKNGKIIEE